MGKVSFGRCIYERRWVRSPLVDAYMIGGGSSLLLVDAYIYIYNRFCHGWIYIEVIKVIYVSWLVIYIF